MLMSYVPYVTKEYYFDTYGGTIVPEELLERYIRQASRHIDSLTFNRIASQGIINMTPFQQDIIREVVCMQAEFEYQNKDIFDMILQGYSINGVSMQFGESWNVTTKKGIPMRKDVYEQLSQTGLCCRLAR